ncbi:MAG: hypothetical protein F4X30_10220, partial [Acidimicrobiaceae bacterium]|nr:hypothetical protein [Acidimicrobiaceae bacterium]
MTAPAVERAAPRSGRWHIPITVEQRAASRFLQQLGVNLVALVLAFGLGAILLLMAGDNPFDVYREMFDRAFG